jgi:hypothetical protein
MGLLLTACLGHLVMGNDDGAIVVEVKVERGDGGTEEESCTLSVLLCFVASLACSSPHCACKAEGMALSHDGEVLDEPPLDLLKAKVVAVELRAGFLEEEAVLEDVEGSGGVRRRLGPREGRGPFELQGLGLTRA